MPELPEVETVRRGLERIFAANNVVKNIELTRPDLRVHAHAQRNEVTLLIDLAGDSLSRRGYRLAGGEAPLRENLAAGILIRAGWPAIAQAGGEFLDPMCGSGTFVIEAAWMATAPGRLLASSGSGDRSRPRPRRP